MECLDQRLFVDGVASVREIVQEVVHFVFLERQDLDEFEEVDGLEVGHPGLQEQVLQVDVYFVDADQEFQKLVYGWLHQVRGHEFDR